MIILFNNIFNQLDYRILYNNYKKKKFKKIKKKRTILTLTGGEFSPVSQISFFGNLCNHFTNFRRKAKFPFWIV